MDRKTRQIERGSFDDPREGARLLIERLRAGEISRDQLMGAAYLGHPVAIKVAKGLDMNLAEEMFFRLPPEEITWSENPIFLRATSFDTLETNLEVHLLILEKLVTYKFDL